MSEKNCKRGLGEQGKKIFSSCGPYGRECQKAIAETIPEFLKAILTATYKDDLPGLAVCLDCGKSRPMSLKQAIEEGIFPALPWDYHKFLDREVKQPMPEKPVRQEMWPQYLKFLHRWTEEAVVGSAPPSFDEWYENEAQEMEDCNCANCQALRHEDDIECDCPVCRSARKAMEGPSSRHVVPVRDECECDQHCNERQMSGQQRAACVEKIQMSSMYGSIGYGIPKEIIDEIQEKSAEFYKELKEQYGDDALNAVSCINSAKYFPEMEGMTPESFYRRKLYETFESVTDIEEMVSDIDDTCDNVESLLRKILSAITRMSTENSQAILSAKSILGTTELKSFDPLEAINPDLIKALIDKRFYKLFNKKEDWIKRQIKKRIRRHEKDNDCDCGSCFEDQLPFFDDYEAFEDAVGELIEGYMNDLDTNDGKLIRKIVRDEVQNTIKDTLYDWINEHNTQLHKDKRVQADTGPIQDLIIQTVKDEIAIAFKEHMETAKHE